MKTSPMIRDFVQSVDDREWQTSLFGLLQNQTYNQCEVDLFELMCKVLDQNLFSQVDWARNSVFFKDLKVCARRLSLQLRSLLDVCVLRTCVYLLAFTNWVKTRRLARLDYLCGGVC